MHKKILIRFGELSLKGKNKMSFVKILANNIKNKCSLTNQQMTVKIDRIFIDYHPQFLEDLKYVFGISSYSVVSQVKNDVKDIEEEIKKQLTDENKSFKVISRRNDKSFHMNSIEMNIHFGNFIVQNSNYKVDIKNPEICFNIEIHKDYAYLFSKKYKGLGGLPVGSSGRILHLISGGIDSPVAAFLMMKRGIKIDYLSFLTPPHTDQKTIDKVNRIVELLNKYQGKTIIYSFNYSILMNYISLTSKNSYRITLMRRSFYRIASKLAIQNNYIGISNGENIGQVASQTLESINAIQEQASFPVYRPLLTNDKLETISLAQKIGTYEISIEKAIEACELFAPKNPVTKPSIQTCYELEKELADLENLENKSIEENIKYIVKKNKV
ncbi:MAG: tRNA uracil 4-sulfurtransferase ThiI [Metamycoplasmataceae bacterium]